MSKLRCILFLLALCALPSLAAEAGNSTAATAVEGPASGGEAVWDGTSYLRVPVRLGSDTRLVMPEPFDDAWERDRDVACTLLDARTLIIRPRNAQIDQRLTLRGRRTGTLYLARVSSAFAYQPVVSVINALQAPPSATRSSPAPAVLLRALLSSAPPPGTQVQASSRVLLRTQGMQISAVQLWRWRGLSGLVTDITLEKDASPLTLDPAALQLEIPDFGVLRALSADHYRLLPGAPPTRLLLVYSETPGESIQERGQP